MVANARVNKNTRRVTVGKGKGKGKRARSPPPNPSPLKSRRRSPRVRVQPAQGPSPKGTGGWSAEDKASFVKVMGDCGHDGEAELRAVLAGTPTLAGREILLPMMAVVRDIES